MQAVCSNISRRRSTVATEPESERLNRDGRLPHHRIPLFNLLQETEKHRLRIETAIVSEAVFIEVGL